MTKDEIRKSLYEIESGVTGTLYSPSDSDMAEGRICYLDIKYAKGDAAADQWEVLKALLYTRGGN